MSFLTSKRSPSSTKPLRDDRISTIVFLPYWVYQSLIVNKINIIGYANGIAIFNHFSEEDLGSLVAVNLLLNSALTDRMPVTKTGGWFSEGIVPYFLSEIEKMDQTLLLQEAKDILSSFCSSTSNVIELLADKAIKNIHLNKLTHTVLDRISAFSTTSEGYGILRDTDKLFVVMKENFITVLCNREEAMSFCKSLLKAHEGFNVSNDYLRYFNRYLSLVAND